MNNKYTYIQVLLCIAIAGLFTTCSDEDKYRQEPFIEGMFTLTLTSPQANLDLLLGSDKENETAVTFTWRMENDKGTDVSTFSYEFDMDIAGNNLETAIPAVVLEEGLSKSYTYKELKDLKLNHWSSNPIGSLQLEARVKATNSTAGAKTRTVWAFTNFTVRNTYMPLENLYLTGEATPAGELPEDAILLDKSEDGKGFYWKGDLSASGGFKFFYSTDTILPSLNKGDEEKNFVVRDIEEAANELFTVERDGTHAIALNITEMSIYYCFLPVENIYLVGDAAGSWNIDGNSKFMTWNRETPNLFTYQGELNPGQLKFPTDIGPDAWLEDFFMAHDPEDLDNTLVAITGDWQDIVIINGEEAMTNPAIDKKWVIPEDEAGNYIITIDIGAMKIRFEKI